LQQNEKNALKAKISALTKMAETQVYLKNKKVPWIGFEPMTYRLEEGFYYFY
jgi:hypothetical protein